MFCVSVCALHCIHANKEKISYAKQINTATKLWTTKNIIALPLKVCPNILFSYFPLFFYKCQIWCPLYTKSFWIHFHIISIHILPVNILQIFQKHTHIWFYFINSTFVHKKFRLNQQKIKTLVCNNIFVRAKKDQCWTC